MGATYRVPRPADAKEGERSVSALDYRFKQVRDLVEREGLRRTLGMIWTRLRHGPGQWKKADIFAHYNFVTTVAPLPTVGRAKSNTLLWVVPDFNIGSGGHLNIFRIIFHLESRGYECTIFIVDPGVHQNAESAKKDILNHFFPLRASVRMEGDEIPATETAIATAWQTAYYVRRLPERVKKIYFVQDFEPVFYPLGSEYVLAENTYRFGFEAITAGEWLAEKLAQEYGMQARSVGFGVEHERYQALPRREPEIKRVFFYARPPTPRRAFELGLLVLNEVHRQLPSAEFVLAGWDTRGYYIPFPHLTCGTVGLDDLPDLYSQCDVALVLSLTNLSLLPLELMACRCAVVSNTGANVEWLLNSEVATLSELTPEGLANAITDLLTDDLKRIGLLDRAEAFANAQDWTIVAEEFEIALKALGESSECVA